MLEFHAAAVSVPALKLLLTPALVGCASWVASRWGPAAGGWVAALPLTSGPVLLVLALEHGTPFAAQACVGVLLALTSLAAFALTYAWAALRLGWLHSTVLGCAGFAACTWPLHYLRASLVSSFILSCLVLTCAIRLLPADTGPRPSTPLRSADVVLRMTAAALLVATVTELAGTVGPRLSGLLTPFPVVATILVACTHRVHGAAAARHVLLGLLRGLFSFATFFFVVGAAVQRRGVSTAFVVGTFVALATHGVGILVLRARPSTPATPRSA